MLQCRLDHLVVTAHSLISGETYVSQLLGVSPEAGGEHPRMGTHNALLRLGEATYLEVIAPRPGVLHPDRPRWFGLDRLTPSTTPCLTTWIARTDDIEAAVAASPIDLGDIEAMSRGPLRWLITIPRDGRMPYQGIAPTLIQWLTEPHPAATLRDQGCSLVRLQGFHPEATRVTSLLAALDFAGEVSVSPLSAGHEPYLVAEIATPGGLRELRGYRSESRSG